MSWSWTLQDCIQLRAASAYLQLKRRIKSKLSLKQINSQRLQIDQKTMLCFHTPSIASMWYKMEYLKYVLATDHIHISIRKQQYCNNLKMLAIVASCRQWVRKCSVITEMTVYLWYASCKILLWIWLSYIRAILWFFYSHGCLSGCLMLFDTIRKILKN